MTSKIGPGHFFEDLSIGMEASIARTVTEKDIEDFARVSGDVNPVHLDEAHAAEIPAHNPPPAADSDLRAAIGILPEKYRRVLVLFYLEDRSYQQVALAMGLPMGTVKTYLHRAKKELAAVLAEQTSRKESAPPWPALNSKI